MSQKTLREVSGSKKEIDDIWMELDQLDPFCYFEKFDTQYQTS
jgi:hypothetical protein